jgi:hypothetical protein
LIALTLIPVDEGRADPLNGRSARRGLPLQLQELVAQSLCPVRQSAVPGPQGLGERVEGVPLLPELAELSAHLIEGAIPIAGAELQLLPSADKNRLASRRKDKHEDNGARKKATS